MSPPIASLGDCSQTSWWVADGWVLGRLRAFLLLDVFPRPPLVQQGLK